MLGHHVSWIVLTRHLACLQFPPSDAVLNPQILHVDMAKLTQSFALDNAECSVGVSVEFATGSDTKVLSKGHQPQGLGCPFCEAV